MTAEEAKKLADDKQLNGLGNILLEIETEANLGRYILYYYKGISSAVKAKLEELGYHVEYQSGRNEWCYFISWK